MEPTVKIGTVLSIGTVKYFRNTPEGVKVGVETKGNSIVELSTSEVESLVVK